MDKSENIVAEMTNVTYSRQRGKPDLVLHLTNALISSLPIAQIARLPLMAVSTSRTMRLITFASVPVI